MNTQNNAPEAPVSPNTICAPADPLAPTKRSPEEVLAARREAWDRTREARRAVTPQQLCALNFEVRVATIVMRTAYKRVLPLREVLVAALPQFDVRAFDMLPTYCDAMAYGAIIAHDREQGVVPTELNAEAEVLWNRLTRRLAVLAEDGFFPEKVLAEVLVGTGWQDRGDDLITMATVAIEYWEKIAGQTTLKREELARAIEVGEALYDHFGIKSAPLAPEELAKERHQAMSLAINAYNEVRRAVGWLRWNEKDAIRFAPSVHRNALTKHTKSASNSESIEDFEGEDDSAEGEDPKKPADPNASAEPKAAKPAGSSIFAPARPEDDVVKYAANGRPLVPQDDPFAKD